MEYQNNLVEPSDQKDSLNISLKILLRGLNYLIDRVISHVFLVIFIVISMMLGLQVSLSEITGYLLYLVTYVSFMFLYYFLSEAIFNKTPGKFITQTQVITEQNTKPPLLKIALRTIGRAIPLNEVSIFALKGQTFHDKISKTDVNLSKLLPVNLQIKRPVNIILTILSYLAFLPVFVMIIWVMADNIVSGDRIDLPNNVPADMKLTKIETKTKYDSDYTELTYKGDERTIMMTWLIAGFDYDSDELCSYMAPTALPGFGYDKIDKRIVCQKLNQNPGKGSKNWRDIIKTNQTTIMDFNRVDQSNIADYYLYKPPNRLNIKVVSGELSEAEILDMYNDGYYEVTYKNLESKLNN